MDFAEDNDDEDEEMMKVAEFIERSAQKRSNLPSTSTSSSSSLKRKVPSTPKETSTDS